MFKFTPKQIIDELYGPPPKKGQKKLEDFRKKNIPKPERPKGEDIVIAQNEKGEQIEYDLEKIKGYWLDFYEKHNLGELADSIRNIDIILSPEQIDMIIEKTKQGFNRLMLMPDPETQSQHLAKIKEETEKSMTGLTDDHQYSDKGTWLSGTVEKAFPDNIQNLNRPTKPYFLLIKDNQEVEENIEKKSADDFAQELKNKGETGLTISEYLVFQRDYTERHKNTDQSHPDSQNWTWLIDSRLASGQVADADWDPDGRQVGVDANDSDDSGDNLGCRSSAILELSP